MDNTTATISDNVKSTENDQQIQSLIEEIKDLNKKIEDTQLKYLELPNYKDIKSELKNLM